MPDFMWKNAEGYTGKKGLEKGNGEREELWAVREHGEQLKILWMKRWDMELELTQTARNIQY